MKTRSVMTLLFLALSCSSCDDTTNLPPTTPGGGFYVQTLGQDNTSGFGVPFATYGINVQGVWDHDNASCLGTPVGDASTWNLNSSNTSLIMVTNGRLCAYWKFYWQTQSPFIGCGNLPPATGYVPIGPPYWALMQYTCILTNGGPIISDALGIQFSPAPTFTDVTSGTITALGTGFSATNGMPLFQYFDLNGTLVAQTNATSVAANGNSAAGPVPSNIGSTTPGFYLGRVSNAAPGGSYTYLNSGSVIVANGGVTIDGYEQSTDVCRRWAIGGDCMMWVTVYDHGTVSITVNGVVLSVSYSQYSTSSTIATDLANTINANTSINTLVSATAWGTQVLINVTQSGSHYSLSATAASSDTGDFPDGSFSAYASAPTL